MAEKKESKKEEDVVYIFTPYIGKMKYYNKPIEWMDKLCSDGKVKREVTKRTSVLECRRNSNHCYVVDYTEDRV